MASTYPSGSQYAAASDQFQPAGYSKVWTKLYSTPAAGADVLVETINFQTVTVLGQVIGSTSNMVNKLQSEAKAHGSQMYGLALYHRKISPINISIPTSFLGIPLPFGGTSLFVSDEYRLVGVHSQFQWALAALGFAVAFGIVIFVVANLHNECGVFSNIAQDFSEAFGGGQTKAITSELIWFVLAGGVFSVGAYLVLRDVTQSTGLSASSVRVPGSPGIAPLQNPLQYAPSYGVGTPAGGFQTGVRGAQLNFGKVGRAAPGGAPARRRRGVRPSSRAA
ncbi:MAG: hypothetical protein ACREN4_07175 [Candidatus Dormibacteria bacterium]